MPVIRPVSDLRNNFNKISEICHHDAEPVFITKNGQGDMVVMSWHSMRSNKLKWNFTRNFSKPKLKA